MSLMKCLPGYWFLGNVDEGVSITVRRTGNVTPIPQNVLLPGRAREWYDKARGDWQLFDGPTQDLCAAWTSRNLVTPLIDGQAYMRDLYGKLLGLKSPASVLLAGWQFTPNLGLMGPDSRSLATQLLAALRGVIARGCELRLLAWDNIKIPTSWWDPNNRNFVEAINEAIPKLFMGAIELRSAYVDANLDGTFLSHHQKEVVIYEPLGKCCAYVGGIDLGIDRWDTTEHKKLKESSTFIAWHDIQLKVEGMAALQLWANFAERWDNNNQWLAKQKESYRLKPCANPTWKGTQPGSHHVQVLRTVTPVRSGFTERTMRYGERTVICALKKAISRAECYIYIEEQFLWDCELADFISQQMLAQPTLKLIVVMAAETELPFHHGSWHYHQRSKFFMTVMGVPDKEHIVFGNNTRVYPYGVYRDDGQAVYVHSKLIIIDDRYVAVGSANFDARSMWVDTELTVAIVDDLVRDSPLNGAQGKVCKFAQELRLQLWEEHLSGKIGVLDPIEALKLFPGTQNDWPRSAAQARDMGRGHIRCYVNVPGKDMFVGKGWPNVLDPSERHFTVRG